MTTPCWKLQVSCGGSQVRITSTARQIRTCEPKPHQNLYFQVSFRIRRSHMECAAECSERRLRNTWREFSRARIIHRRGGKPQL